ncbi:mycothiol acetyltransferase [Spirilliplanes yamanashiensis]|uniref:Mycothiol acetyltransferase n=1 Tax=Spirilliplanes yamanashiensis TaxID=42233 RepID=A0A8J3Y5C0_9ACTN|nr:mycothiol acetyltransferase [Spirilliplanes yamanashiensis]
MVHRATVLSPGDAAEVLALAAAAAETDGVFPLDEHTVFGVRSNVPAAAVHLTVVTDFLAGYGQADLSAGTGELVVHPAARGRGLGRALLDAALDAGARRFWAHGDHPAAAALAAAAGLTRDRVLWQFRRPLTDPLPDRPLPAGLTLRAFRPGQDDAAWLDLNARAFAGHPEQGRWTAADLAARMAEPWFDPAGFLLAVDAGGKLAGFHWTKVHPDGLGEVYVLGVDPAGHRAGLGSALTVAGLRHLAGLGLHTALLYVDESNPAAVTLYRRLGFTTHATDVMYTR